ncbi:hypothetical protein HYQ44_020290 [Verticillium longisporum]|nr:hypothetical protein HYQ44_020290 [Verticillium longisporum]
MKTSAILTPLALVAVGLQPVSADIGRGAGLVIDLFGQGIAELFVEIFSKRDAANVIVRRQVPGVPEFEYQRCREDIAGLTITATSPAPNYSFATVKEILSTFVELAAIPLPGKVFRGR